MKTIIYVFVLVANALFTMCGIGFFTMNPKEAMLPALITGCIGLINLLFIFFVCPPDEEDIKLKKFSIGSVLPNPFAGLANIYPFIYFKRKRLEEEKRIAELNK